MSKYLQAPTYDRRCGTRAGYRAHHRRGEDACTECKHANSDYVNPERKRPYRPASKAA